MAARPFDYPENMKESEKEPYREKTLKNHKDTLYYDERKNEKFNLIFCSSLVSEWLDVIRQKYPELQETKQDGLIKFKFKSESTPGTICAYPQVKFVVHGKALMERFERDFPDMKARSQTDELPGEMAAMAITINQTEGEDTLPSPPLPTPSNPTNEN